MKKILLTILIIGMIGLVIAGNILIQNYQVEKERKDILDRANFTEIDIPAFECNENGCPEICIPTIDNLKVCTNPKPYETYCKTWLNESKKVYCIELDKRLRTDAQIQSDIDKLKERAINNVIRNQLKKEASLNVTHTFDGEDNTIIEKK